MSVIKTAAVMAVTLFATTAIAEVASAVAQPHNPDAPQRAESTMPGASLAFDHAGRINDGTARGTVAAAVARVGLH